MENFTEIKDLRINIDKEYLKYDLAEGDIELFFDNSLFNNQKLKINTGLINLIQFINLSLLELQYHLQDSTTTSDANNNTINNDGNRNALKKTDMVKKFYHEKAIKYVELRQDIYLIKNTLKQRLSDISEL